MQFNFIIKYRPNSLQILPNAFNCKSENVLKDVINERLLVYNKILLNKNVFINNIYILENIIEGLEILISTEYIYNL